MRQGDGAGWQPTAEHKTGIHAPPLSFKLETLLTAGLLGAPSGPNTTRGSKISPHFPLQPADSSSQVFQESETFLLAPLGRSRLRVHKIRAQFKNIHLALPVAIREFFSERSSASA
jgi:hypothetical protein